MKKKIAILGSTGSIGKTLVNILKKNKNEFEIVLLTANKNSKELLKQAIFFDVKNLILTNKKSFNKIKKKKLPNNINIFNNFHSIKKLFKKKIDYVMSSISGIDGLEPTVEIIKFTKLIAIANKESIICGWNIILKELKKNNTKFIPVDSEHFSIHYALKEKQIKNVENIYLTASGGPLINLPLKKFKKIKISQALNHPNWKMGKKISIDSATMMNKVFEIIEAKKIFNISYSKLNILVHPKSYIHGVVKFNDGMIKIIAHDTDMKIPIFNTIYDNNFIETKEIDLKKLNNLNFSKVNFKRFPLVKIISYLPDKNTLFETLIVSANDELVKLFLNNKIKFTEISTILFKFLRSPEFIKYKKIQPNNVENIKKLNEYVRFKINQSVYK
jgi:1-deoxy-D-xylulose-5-phosphate reductoisomerase